MKKIFSSLLTLFSIVAFSNEPQKIDNEIIEIAETDYYRIYVTRVEKDLYRTTDNKIFIKTKYCWEWARNEEVILVYNKYSRFDNKLIFKNGTSCDVEKVF